jgi:diguanylate cyclase (GGDEF)-like protein
VVTVIEFLTDSQVLRRWACCSQPNFASRNFGMGSREENRIIRASSLLPKNVMSFADSTLLANDQDPLLSELRNAADCEACLIVVRGNQQGQRFELSANVMTLGRDNASDIVIDDPRVSRKQASLVKDGAIVRLVDGGSTNGTHINDRKVSGGDSVVLSKEDMIRVGGTILKYLPRGELEIHYIGMLESRAHTDALTKMYNKGYLLEAMEAEFKRAQALGHELSLLVFDLDFFKRVNDTYGHDAGDQVLIEVSALLKSAMVAYQGILGRFGGEEFVALLPGFSLEQALSVAESIRSRLEAHAINYKDAVLKITASIGVATLDATTTESKALFKRADQGVYAAKESGRNRVCAT